MGVGDRETIRAPACRLEIVVLNIIPRSPNQLLASLPPTDFELIRPHLRSIKLTHQTVLVRAGERLPHIYFPLAGIVSLNFVPGGRPILFLCTVLSCCAMTICVHERQAEGKRQLPPDSFERVAGHGPEVKGE